MTNLANLERIINGLRSFNAESEVENIVINNSVRLTELMQDQLAAGVDISGRKRLDSYRPLTIQIKKTRGVGLGAVTDRVTFFMTGKLYNSLRVDVKKEKFIIFSPLPTYDKMIDRVGPEKYGLDYDQRLDFATTVTLPEFSKVFEEKTTIKI